MANHLSAKKAYKRSEKKRLINKSRMSRIKTFTRQLEEMLSSGASQELMKQFSLVQSETMKAVSKGVLKLTTASRKIKRLAVRVKDSCLNKKAG